MNTSRIDALVRAVLYEGYVLYPYRASSIKNRHRFTFGTLYPESWCARNEGDASSMQTECIVHAHESAVVEIAVRFLHLIERGKADAVRHEAVERTVEIAAASLSESARTVPFRFDALEGRIEVSTEPVRDEILRLRVRIFNATSAVASSRDEALGHSFVSAHTLIALKNGDFVSSFDPPPELAADVATCTNVGTWPVLVGSDGAHDIVLSSPVVLYDYPAVAPESPGDLFDATEIDEILTLRILTLTDAEKDEIRRTDPRASALLDRTLALGPNELANLHGALRTRKHCAAGDRVRLRPAARGDVFDLALQGKTATIQSIEQDFEGRTFFAVVVDDDPGRDLGIAGQPGHRFFFRPDEVEVLS